MKRLAGLSFRVHFSHLKAAEAASLAVLAGASIGLASCGSGSPSANGSPAPATTTVSQKSLSAYQDCLKAHGLTFPSYNSNSKAPTTTVAPSVRNAAVSACANLRPGGATFTPTKSQQKVLAAYSACLKAHGVNIPTPSSAGTPGPVAGSGSGSGSGSFRSQSESPAFASAAKACSSLRPNFGGGRPGTHGTTTTTAAG